MLLDSNIVIYAAELNYDSVRRFIRQQQSPFVSVISKVEVLGYYDFTPEKKIKLERLFDTFSVISISDDIVAQAIELRQQQKMSLGDALIAATALVHNLKLATANVKDFRWIEPLEIINPV
ncbi:MAG: putative nucleic acid-binding protein [Phenylobacterium sp.]|jgi:predicted nucleic acid-binding protein